LGKAFAGSDQEAEQATFGGCAETGYGKASAGHFGGIDALKTQLDSLPIKRKK
jgi:hypothetical protein